MFPLRCLRFQQLPSSGQKVSIRKSPRSPRNTTAFFTKYPLYWKDNFDGRIRNFKEIPGPEPSFKEDGIWRSKISGDSIETIHETQENWIKRYGYVVREYVSKDRCIIHLHHPEDMNLVHMGDPGFKLLDDTFVRKSRCRKDISQLNACNWLAPSASTEWSFLTMPIGFEKYTYDSIPLEDVVTDFLAEIRSKMDGEIDILPWLFRWAFESIGLFTLSIRLGALSEDQHFDTKVAIQKLKTWKDTAYLAMDSAADEKRNIKKEMKDSKDFLFAYFSKYVHKVTRDQRLICEVNTFLNKGWNRSSLATFLMDVFQQGVHKLSYTMAYTLRNIAADSSFQDSTRADLKKLSPSKDSEFYTAKEKRTGREDVWTGSWYIRGVIKESLRLHPAIYGTTEVLTESLILGGYDIPKGTILVFHHQFASRQQRYFPDPLKFNPRRGMSEDHGGALPTLPPQDCLYLEYIVSFGSTICIMEAFSGALMTLLLSKLIRNFLR